MILKHTSKTSAECEDDMECREMGRVGRESLLEVQNRKERHRMRSIK